MVMLYEEFSKRELGSKASDKVGVKSIKIYRAVALGVSEFKNHDYITPIKKFSVEHAENNHIYNDEQQQVIEAIVSTSDLYTANNPGEYLYFNNPIKGKVIYKTLGYDYEGYDEIVW